MQTIIHLNPFGSVVSESVMTLTASLTGLENAGWAISDVNDDTVSSDFHPKLASFILLLAWCGADETVEANTTVHQLCN